MTSGFFQMSPETLELYDYQEEAVEELRSNIRRGARNQVLCAPTGSGKTIVATYLLREAHQKGSRAVFLADRITLVNQTSAVLDTYGIPHGVIQGDHWRYRPKEHIQVASPQTLARRKWPRDLDLIIVDEAHSLHRNTLSRIKARDCVTIGLTATPFSRGMGKYYEEVVSVTTTHKLIAEGRLAPFRAYSASEPDMTGAKVSAGEWTIKEASDRAIPIVGDCVAEYLDKADGRKFIAFGADVAHCKELQRQFQQAGIQVAVTSYRTPAREHEEILEEFRKPNSTIRGLASVAKLAKGFDVPDIGCIIMARPLKSSLTEHIQILGRGLRSHPGKQDCCVLDHAGNMARFWGPMNAFFDSGEVELDDGTGRQKKERKEKGKEGRRCPKCYHVHNAAPNCPNCGHEYPKKKRAHLPGRLRELGNGALVDDNEKQRVYSELLHIAQSRGYKSGWVGHSYRDWFGVWPRGMVEVAKEPRPSTIRWVRNKHRRLAATK